jgi:hypothetical protein
MTDALIPGCVEIPKVSGDLEISLPYGASLQAFRDFSKGVPDDCALINNLLVQLAPLLGSMACLVKVLKSLEAVKGWLEDATTPDKLLSGAVDVVESLADLAPCFLAVTPAGIAPFIKDILLAIIKLLRCIIQSITSILDFQAGLDFNAAEGNPVMIAQLECAQANASETMAHSLAALGPIGPLLDLVAPLLEIVGLSLETPPMDEIMGMTDVSDAIDQIDAVIGQIETVVEALPI